MESKAVVEENLVNQARERLIQELEKSVRIYGPTWINRETCTKIIEELRNKKPTKLRGPLWGDHLDSVLYDLGFRPNEENGKYQAIRERLEAVEEET